MCYELDARPPFPPVGGGASATGESIVLTSADGAQFRAYGAAAISEYDATRTTGIVVLPDVRGLFSFYEDLALRLADTGVNAVAIDYFGRTAGTEPRDEDFDFMPHVEKVTPEQVAEDVTAAIEHLRGATGAEALFTIGFCMGGRASFSQAWRQPALDGVIGLYGRVAKRDETDEEAPILHVDAIRCPVLGLFGGADAMIPPKTVDEFKDALDARRIPNEMHVYAGAPHSFFDRAFDQYKTECNDAWIKILAFIRRNSPAT